jgi:hypothetical protein
MLLLDPADIHGSHGQHCDYDLYRAFDGSDRNDYGNIHQQSCGE